MTSSKVNQRNVKITQYLPHNFLAERTILSCLLINSKAIEFMIKTTPAEIFYFKNHQEIYKTICFMYKKDLVINILTLTIFLQKKGLLNRIGGIVVLVELINQTPNLIYLNTYVQLIKDKFFRRKLIKLGYEIINNSYVTTISIENTVVKIEEELFNLSITPKDQVISTNATLLNNMFQEVKQKFLNPTLPGLSSGFTNLDLLTQGFQKSDFIILAGRPSIGKTALSLTMALNIIKDLKTPVLFFSLEMAKEQLMYRLLSMETKIGQNYLKNGRLSQNDWAKLNRTIKIFSKLPFFIDDTPNLSIQNIRKKIKRVVSEHNKIGLIIIDYLQLIQNPVSPINNRVQELSQITRSLKIFAREFNVPIIALSQLNRNVENRIDQKPILSDLRESGTIEQDADLVLLLYNLKLTNSLSVLSKTSDSIGLIVAKQRNGPLGDIKLIFNKTQTKFLEFEN